MSSTRFHLLVMGITVIAFTASIAGMKAALIIKMYKLVATNDDSVDLVFSDSNNLKAYLAEVTYKRL